MGVQIVLRAILYCSVLLLELVTDAQTARINEIQPSNTTTLYDEDGDSSDWIELWNPGSESIDLGGFGLSDDSRNPFKWTFQKNTQLSPMDYLVVFASGKNRQPEPANPLDPSNVSGLSVWLSAEAINASNETEVRTSGIYQFVRLWRDLSGKNTHAVQTAENLQPRLIAGTEGNLASLRFDGANDLLRLPFPAATNSFCIFVVCRTAQNHETDPQSSSGAGGTSGQRYLFGARHGGDLDAGAGLSIGTNGISIYEHGSGYMPALASYRRPIGSGLQVIAMNYDNRQPSIDSQGLAVCNGLASPRREVWSPIEIGSGGYGAFGGDIYELIMYSRPLTSSERRGIAWHLARRYGISMPLPRHTGFQLNSEGEDVVLTRPDGVIVDTVSFGPIPRDVSYGRSSSGSSQWQFFASPTPGASNSTPGSTEWLFSPDFSHEGGFYSNTFDLKISSTNVNDQIRYTLDGSEPTTNSFLYVNPIRITSRAGTANDLSAIPTVPGGLKPAAEVFKGWVIRARAFKKDAMPSTITTRTYWIHPKGYDRYTVPIVALTTDRKNFFDPDIGIYIPGKASGGNYSQRGPEWERPVHVEFYETNHHLIFAQEGDVKIHGNTSQGFPIKGLDLDATGGIGRKPFQHAFFPNRKRTEFEHILLRPSGHDHAMAFMRDELMQELGAETGAESQAARPCIVFINGEYWGLHYLKEKEDNDFISYYGDIPVDSLDYLEGYASAKGGDTVHYDAMIRFITTNNPAMSGVYEEIQNLMDVPNYIDYKVCEIFNYRWDIGNHRLWRPRTPEGRWRWLQFDNDVGWGGFWADQPAYSYNMLAADLSTDGRLHGHNKETTTFLLRRLIPNSEFRREFINRFADLLNTTLSTDNTLAHIGALATRLAPEMAEHCQRWRYPATLSDWQKAVDYLRDFARRRPAACRQQLSSYFNLSGTVQLSLDVLPAGAGTLQLNTLVLPLTGDAPWTGTYFKNSPVRLVAQANKGYVFTGWDGLVGVSTNNVQVLLQGDWSIAALFIPAAPAKLTATIARPNELTIHLSGLPNQLYDIEFSSNLQSWALQETIKTNSDGQSDITISLKQGSAQYFRARRQSP